MNKMSISKSDNTRLRFLLGTLQALEDVPAPTIAWALSGKGGAIAAYDIRGYFEKSEHVKYLRDVTKRFEQTHNCKQTNIEPVTEPIIFNGYLYDLKEITEGLRRLNRRIKTFSPDKQMRMLDDELFKKAQIVCEFMIRDFGSFTRKELYHAIKHDLGGTESEARCKSKNMHRYYENRGFKPLGRYHQMNRSDNAKKQSEKKAKRAKAAVLGAIESMKFLNENITAVAVGRNAGVDRRTAKKYMDELKADNLI